MAFAANHAWYKPILFWLNEAAACCYFGVDLGKELFLYSFSCLTDGIPHSSSDSLYFTLLLPFTSTNSSKSNSLSPFCLFGQKFSKSKVLFFLLFGQKYSRSNSNFTKHFSVNFILCLSRKILPILQIYSKSHFLSDLEKFPSSRVHLPYSCRRSLNSGHWC